MNWLAATGFLAIPLFTLFLWLLLTDRLLKPPFEGGDG